MSLTDLIEFQAFSSVWFWILLALFWTSAGSRVLGIPFDMINRARRDGAMALTEVEHLAHIFAARILRAGDLWALVLLGLAFFVLTVSVLLGFVYGFELAQAVAMFTLPGMILGVMTQRLAYRVYEGEILGDELLRVLTRHRLRVQALGMAFLFVSALWGMYWVLSRGI
ncbi:MAG: component of SufBCD complex [Marinibacterium sp.]|nr:component of SufBCD complex [Marinibacterium sp.]